MADRASLEEALIRAHESGDTEAAKLFASEIKALPPTFRQKVQASVPMRMVQGARDAIDAGAQLLPAGLENVTSGFGLFPNPVSEFMGSEAARVDKMVKDAEKQYQEAREKTGSTGFDFARLTGNIVSPANAAIAARIPIVAGTSIPMMAAKGAAGGAAAGLLSPVTDENAEFWPTKGAQVGLGAATGGLLAPVIGKVAEKATNAISRKIADQNVIGVQASLRTDQGMRDLTRDLGPLSTAIPEQELGQVRQQVLDALKQGKDISASALQRQRDFAALKVEPTLGQLTRDPMQFARERNLRGVEGVGEPLQLRLGAQNRALTEKVGGYGGAQAGEAYSAGKTALERLAGVDEEKRQAVSAAYNVAREAAGRDATIPTQGLAQDYARIVYDFGRENIPSAIRNRMKEFGLTSEQGIAPKQLTINDAEHILQLTNKLRSPTEPARNAALDVLNRSVKDAIRNMDEAGGVFAPARELASKRFQLQEAVPALRAAVEGTATPDKFVQDFVIRAPAKDVRNMVAVFDEPSKKSVRDQIGAFLSRAAFGENAAGDKPFAQERFAKALRDIGTEKLKAFYTQDEIYDLFRIARVGAYINSIPAASAVNTSNTAGAMMNLARSIPGVPGGVNLANNLLQMLGRGRFVSNAVNPQIPVGRAPLLPGAEPALTNMLSLVGPVGGGLLGNELR